jgi:hypothetical protein
VKLPIIFPGRRHSDGLCKNGLCRTMISYLVLTIVLTNDFSRHRRKTESFTSHYCYRRFHRILPNFSLSAGKNSSFVLRRILYNLTGKKAHSPGTGGVRRTPAGALVLALLSYNRISTEYDLFGLTPAVVRLSRLGAYCQLATLAPSPPRLPSRGPVL